VPTCRVRSTPASRRSCHGPHQQIARPPAARRRTCAGQAGWARARPRHAAESRRPRNSRSCITLRIVAADLFAHAAVSVREPTGSPLSRYPSTTRRNTSRERSFSSFEDIGGHYHRLLTSGRSLFGACAISRQSGLRFAWPLSADGAVRKGKFMRPSNRQLSEMRPISIETGITKHAEGSCLIRMGDTHVLCTASLEDGCRPS
jgi:hypothetical protein